MNDTQHDKAAVKRLEALADRPGAPKGEQDIASQMIYREHAIAIVRGELIDPFWYYGGHDPEFGDQSGRVGGEQP